jgi:ceramide glucosyltransferase
VTVTLLQWIVLLGAVTPLVYYAFASCCAWRYAGRNRRSAGTVTPPVTILKPVRGLDRETYENFVSFARQDYPEFEMLFAVAEEDDPAVPVIRRVIQDFPGRSIRLVVGAPALGANSKVNKLCRLMHEARWDVVVTSDSDVRVEPHFLRDIVAPFEDPRVGAVTMLYRGISDGRLGADLEAIGLSSDWVAGVLVARRLGDVGFAFGAAIATTRERLAEIGGFEALVDYCADDYEVGHRIAARGFHVALPRHIVESESVGTTFLQFFRHQLRWAVTTRHSRPSGYLGSILTQGLPWSLAAAIAAPSSSVAWSYVGAYAVLRAMMAWTAGIRVLGDPVLRRKWWLVPVRDAIWFVVWTLSFFRNRVVWRGREFRLRKGRMVPLSR